MASAPTLGELIAGHGQGTQRAGAVELLPEFTASGWQFAAVGRGACTARPAWWVPGASFPGEWFTEDVLP